MVVKKTKKRLVKGKRTKKVCQKGGRLGKGGKLWKRKTKSTTKTNSNVTSAVLKYMNHILQSSKTSQTLSLSNNLKKKINSHLELKNQRTGLLTSPNETIKLIKQNPNLINFLKLSTTSKEYSKLTPKQQKQYKNTIEDLLKPQETTKDLLKPKSKPQISNITVIKPNINEQTPLGKLIKSPSMLNLGKETNRNAAKEVSEILRSQDAPTDSNPLKYTLNQREAEAEAIQAVNNARLGEVNPINPKTFKHLISGPTHKTTKIILANGTTANMTGETNRKAAKEVSEILRSQDAPTDPNPLKYNLNKREAEIKARQAVNNARLGEVNPINPKTFKHLISGPPHNTTKIILANGKTANMTRETLLPPLNKREVPKPPPSPATPTAPKTQNITKTLPGMKQEIIVFNNKTLPPSKPNNNNEGFVEGPNSTSAKKTPPTAPKSSANPNTNFGFNDTKSTYQQLTKYIKNKHNTQKTSKTPTPQISLALPSSSSSDPVLNLKPSAAVASAAVASAAG